MFSRLPLSARFCRHIVGAAAACLGAIPSLNAQFSYSESFRNSTAPGWSFYQGNSGPGPRLTAGAAPTAADPETSSFIDAAGSGWLRLATTTANQSNAAYFNSYVPSINDVITVRFNVAMWGDRGEANGGDGLTFFMRDASQALPSDGGVGAFGGSIGYAQKTGIDGLNGGYFGVALDVYGNYSNPTEGRVGGVGARENAVVLRGPGNGQTGYNYLAGTGGYDFTETGSATVRESTDPAIAALTRDLDFSTATARPDQALYYRTVEISLDHASNLRVSMQFGEDSGAWTNLFTASLASFSRPDELAFGFSSGTGGANQVYEISNMTVHATAASNIYTWDAGAASDYWEKNDFRHNWGTNQNPSDNAVIIFGRVSTDGTPAVIIRAEDKIVDSVRFTETSGSYTVSSSGGYDLIFDAAGSSTTSFLQVGNSGVSTGGHRITADVVLNNKLVVQNDDANRTFTFAGSVNAQGNDLTIDGAGNTTFSSAVAAIDTLEKLGSGTLRFDSTLTTTELLLNAGTIYLSSAHVTGTTLRITGDSFIDFGTGGSSILDFDNVIVEAGATLTILNWSNAVDYFYADNLPSVQTLGGIHFNGFADNATKWISYNKQITPVPEPSTYGAILVGSGLALLGLLRFRARRRRA